MLANLNFQPLASYLSGSGIWLDRRILANDIRFTKFTKVFPCRHFALYSIPSVFLKNLLNPHCCTSVVLVAKIKYYLADILQLQRTTPLSYLEGELFEVDVTCDNEGGNGKLFFKHNGTRNLLEKGN